VIISNPMTASSAPTHLDGLCAADVQPAADQPDRDGGGVATFAVTATGLPAPSYQWYFDNSDLWRATNAVLTLTGVTTNEAGWYSAMVWNPGGSVTSTNASLTVIAVPVIIAQPTIKPCCRGAMRRSA